MLGTLTLTLIEVYPDECIQRYYEIVVRAFRDGWTAWPPEGPRPEEMMRLDEFQVRPSKL